MENVREREKSAKENHFLDVKENMKEKKGLWKMSEKIDFLKNGEKNHEES